jgi:7-cyano-7-deazaguanine synthase
MQFVAVQCLRAPVTRWKLAGCANASISLCCRLVEIALYYRPSHHLGGLCLVMAERKEKRKGRATVLLSGGIDSSTCLAYCLDEGFDVDAVFVSYGQVASTRELRAAKSVCRHFHVPLRLIRLAQSTRKGPGLILGRNAFLAFVVLLEAARNARIIAIGIHSGTRYRDCTPLFVKEVQNLFDLSTGGSVRISAPFLKWTKRDIWELAKRLKVPLSATYSCERGCKQPCGKCDSCSDLESLRACAK